MLFINSILEHLYCNFQIFCRFILIDKFVKRHFNDKSIINVIKFNFTIIKNTTMCDFFNVLFNIEVSCKRNLLFET